MTKNIENLSGDYTVRVMSFNVYFSNLTPERTADVAKIIDANSPDVVGIQEGTPLMCGAIKERLCPLYAMVGIGRDGTDMGENCNIFYRTDKFELLDSGTIWLTHTPDSFSILENAGMARIATFAKLKRIADGCIFIHVNTHYDLESDEVRKEESLILTRYIENRFGKSYPTTITGDFNCTEGTAGYNALIDAGFTATNNYGEKLPTFQAWGNDSQFIDFTFVNGLFPVKSYTVGSPVLDGEYKSDHNPLISDLILLPA